MNSKRTFGDARDFQIVFLGLFLILGVWYRDWLIRPQMVLVTLGSCLLVQWIGYKFGHADQTSWRSAMITGLSLCLLLRANSPWTLALAATLSIAEKFVFKIRGKHFF